MSEGRPAQQGVVASQFITTWKNIVDHSQHFRRCLDGGAGGQAKGGYVPINRKSSRPRPRIERYYSELDSSHKHHIRLTYALYLVPGGTRGAAMYMYTSDSNWNTVAMNTYMSSGLPALPYTQPNQLGLSHNTSSPNQLDLLSNASLATGNSSEAVSVPIKPLAPGELVLQD